MVQVLPPSSERKTPPEPPTYNTGWVEPLGLDGLSRMAKRQSATMEVRNWAACCTNVGSPRDVWVSWKRLPVMFCQVGAPAITRRLVVGSRVTPKVIWNTPVKVTA